MTRDELQRLHLRWLDEMGWDEPHRLDLTELPGDDDPHTWEAWADTVPAFGVGLDFDRTLSNVDAWLAECDRRRSLVAHAKALIAYEKSKTSLAARRRDAEDLPAQLALRAAENRVRAQAYDAMRAITRLTPTARKREATFTLRCPKGCVLAVIFRRRAHGLDAGAESLLVITNGQHGTQHVAWLATRVEQHELFGDLEIACRHGAGTFPTGVPDFVDRSGKTTRRTVDVPSVSWSPKMGRHRYAVNN